MALPAGFSPEQLLASLPPDLRLMVLQRLSQGGGNAPQPMLPDESGQVPPSVAEPPLTDTSAPVPIARGPRPPSFEGDMIDPRTGQRWDRNIGPSDRRRLLEQAAQGGGGQGAAPPPAGRPPDAGGGTGLPPLTPPGGERGGQQREGRPTVPATDQGKGVPYSGGNQVMSGPGQPRGGRNSMMAGPAPVGASAAGRVPTQQDFMAWLTRRRGSF